MGIENGALRRFSADIARAQSATGKLAQVVVRKTARDIVKDAKIIAQQKFSPAATGKTANSIGHSDLRTVGTSGDLSVEIGPTTHYAPFLETGTSRMAAMPFMGPAADRNQGPFEQAMAQIAEEGLRG